MGRGRAWLLRVQCVLRAILLQDLAANLERKPYPHVDKHLPLRLTLGLANLWQRDLLQELVYLRRRAAEHSVRPSHVDHASPDYTWLHTAVQVRNHWQSVDLLRALYH